MRWIALAVVVALTGCGRGDSERAASAVTERFLSAVEAGGASYFLELTRAGWRISAAGCERLPDDEPYDCEAAG